MIYDERRIVVEEQEQQFRRKERLEMTSRIFGQTLQVSNPYFSETMMSNIFTMGCCAKKDPRQMFGAPYSLPSEEIRLLRAKLILEEALESVKGLGFRVILDEDTGDFYPIMDGPPNLEDIIDGCIDTAYVTTGTLVSCGVPDLAHIRKVNSANNRKFPGGKAIFREDGKFLKPPGWRAPVHCDSNDQILQENMQIPWGKVTEAVLDFVPKNQFMTEE